MYRLLKIRSVFLTNANTSTQPAYMHTSSYLCSFCKFYHPQISKSTIYQQIKHQSTTVNPLQKIKSATRSSKPRMLKNYIELLKVTNSATKEGKTKVKKLKAADLSKLVDEKSIQEYKELSPKLKITRSLKQIEEELEEKGKEEKVPKNKKKKKDRKNLEKNYTDELEDDEEINFHIGNEKEFKLLERQWKQNNKYQYTLSYFETNAKCGKIDRALQTFNQIKRPENKSAEILQNEISMYNFFLNEYSSRGNIKIVKDLLTSMKKDSYEMTAESYAAVFECIGRSENPSEEIDFLNSLKEQMEKNNIKLNDIIINSVYTKDKLEKVLKSIRLLDNNFIPTFKKADINYNCNLLKNIFKKRSPESPGKNIFTISDLVERSKQQFKVELDGNVKIRSVAKVDKPSEECLNAVTITESMDDETLCKVCLDAPIECVILECGHMACCINCGKQMSECPICRQYVVRVVRFFKA